ncbi:hypothetical protein HRI_004039200 [Hibiscus trionum]|uniref:RNase H type-1 domain-containing protein n=1 Tax=Hibiscus trionum TaxID=183268 RepID=A0A9W7ML80_HIBTR|nr:hypothetical protein HRI_004039200 [Hibiscus trionum]
MSFFGIVWSIWLERNEVLFNKRGLCLDRFCDSTALHIGLWCKSKWPKAVPSLIDFVRFPNLCNIEASKARINGKGVWSAPPLGSLKFNVDTAVLGSFGHRGIGGILRDHNGTPLIRFSKSIGLVEPTRAKILAICKAGRIFMDWKKHEVGMLMVESDYLLAVQWINKIVQPTGSFVNLISECGNIFANLNWNLAFAGREKNMDAHNHAKRGINLAKDWVWVVDSNVG